MRWKLPQREPMRSTYVILLLWLATYIASCYGDKRSLSSTHCPCEGQHCTGQFSGDPCHVECGTPRLLSNFTVADLRVTEQYLATNPSNSGGLLCLWIIDPLQQTRFSTRVHNTSSNISSSSINNYFLHIQINSVANSSNRLLIYRGLPSLLTLPESNISHSSITNSSIPSSDYQYNLIGSLSGRQLLDNSLVIKDNVLTLVYLYSGNGTESAAINISFCVNSADTNSTDNQGSPTDDDIAVITGEISSLRPHLLIPSLSKLLSQQSSNQNTGTNTTSDQQPTETQSYNSSVSSFAAPTCSSRYWHTSVYSVTTSSLWVYGGLDLEGVPCRGLLVINISLVAMDMGGCEGCVQYVAGGEVEPGLRILHTAVVVKCPNSTVDDPECMLLFGGFPSVGDLSIPSSQLWLYRADTETWTQLSSAPVGVGGHSAVLVGGATLLVVGGVRDGGMSSLVMSYGLMEDSWERWDIEQPAMYGHSAVYDVTTHSVYVFGGVVYSRPSADISSSLYVLDIATRNWARVLLAAEVPGRVFHSMILTNNTLFISGGGMITSQPASDILYRGLGSLTHSESTVLVDLASSCLAGKTTLVRRGAIKLWGHSMVTYNGTKALVTGGFSGVGADFVLALEPPGFISCSMAEDLQQCQSLPDCVSCVDQAVFIGCLDPSDTWLCNSANRTIIQSTNNCNISKKQACSQFSNCLECLSTDIAQELGCLWQSCSSSCVLNTTVQLNCTRVASSLEFNARRRTCPFDLCSRASCQECNIDLTCGWTFIEIRTNLNQSTFSISTQRPQWGCYLHIINLIVARELPQFVSTEIATCPRPCSLASSCFECVQSDSASAGPLNCVWESYTERCIQTDLVPIICSDGVCGGFVTAESQDQCVPSCFQHKDCQSCKDNPKCVWFTDTQQIGHCTEIFSSSNPLMYRKDETSSETFEIREYYFNECPVCLNNCSSRGVCVYSNLSCECELGFVGVDCSVECECGQLSYCANSSEAGRRVCLECQQNTQGSGCDQCQPFFAGNPGNGSGCDPCIVYCHGNSEVCLRRSEVNEAINEGVSMTKTGLQPLLVSGPSPEELVCVECGGNTVGDTCDSCQPGYYGNSQNNNLDCVECQCNGHGLCEPSTGVCVCQNHTRTCDGCSLNVQCTECVNGYTGAPSDGNQCYLQFSINRTLNFTILPQQSVAIATSLDFMASNIPVRVHFIRRFGEIEIYDTLSNRALSVIVDPTTFEHVVDIRSTFELSRVTRDVQSDSSIDKHSMQSKRQAPGEIIDVSEVHLHEFLTGAWYTIAIYPGQPGFMSLQHYITVLAGVEGASFQVFYEQQTPHLSYPVFVSILFSSFFLSFGVALFIWKGIKMELKRRHRAHEKLLRESRSRRPFTKVLMYFDRKQLKGLTGPQLNPLLKQKVPLTGAVFVSTSPHEVLSMNKEAVDHTANTLNTGKGDSMELQTTVKKPQKKKITEKIVDPCDTEPWVVAQEVCREGTGAVSTVIIKLPTMRWRGTGSRPHVICTGSSLISQPRVEKWKIRNNRVSSSVL